MNVIELTNVCKNFGSRHVIADLNLAVKAGEFVALIGPSGVGKSTVLNMMGLLDEPTSGTVAILGEAAPKPNSKKATLLRRNHINYLFQTNALLPEASVAKNLLLALHYQKQSKQEKMAAIAAVLAELDLAGRENEIVATLSGGEQQRVAIARALLKPGEIILADEPTGALDDDLAHRVFAQFDELRNKYNKTVIMVTHNQALAKQCDRQIELTKP